MTPLDIVLWENIREYNIRYPTKYTIPFRVVKLIKRKISERRLSTSK